MYTSIYLFIDEGTHCIVSWSKEKRLTNTSNSWFSNANQCLHSMKTEVILVCTLNISTNTISKNDTMHSTKIWNKKEPIQPTVSFRIISLFRLYDAKHKIYVLFPLDWCQWCCCMLFSALFSIVDVVVITVSPSLSSTSSSFKLNTIEYVYTHTHTYISFHISCCPLFFLVFFFVLFSISFRFFVGAEGVCSFPLIWSQFRFFLFG